MRVWMRAAVSAETRDGAVSSTYLVNATIQIPGPVQVQVRSLLKGKKSRHHVFFCCRLAYGNVMCFLGSVAS